MKLSGFYSDNSKFGLGTSVVVFFVCILIFQNCGRIVLSDKIKQQSSAAILTAVDIEATDIINTMINSGIKDTNEFDDLLEYSATSMTCGTKVGSTKVECAFRVNDKNFISSSATAVNVRNFLNNKGIVLDCPTCTEAQSYTVKNIACSKDVKFPREATCTLTR